MGREFSTCKSESQDGSRPYHYTAFLSLALCSQDSPFSPDQSTEEGEVAALRLTARSQVSVSLC